MTIGYPAKWRDYSKLEVGAGDLVGNTMRSAKFDFLRRYIMTNSHSPGMVRAFAPLRNVDAWYEAFEVKESDRNYVKPEERVRIW